MSNLSLTFLPSHKRARETAPDTDPASGVLTFTARPARHTWALGQSALIGLGVRPDIRGSGRNHNEDLTALRCWLAAHRVSLIVVRHATYLDTPMLEALATIADSVTRPFGNEMGEPHAPHIAFTCDEDTGPELAAWVSERFGLIHDWQDQLDALRKTHTRLTPAFDDPTADTFPRHLPHTDFYLWRAACRDTLPEADFAVVDQLYRDTFDDIASAAYTSDEDASARLAAAFAAHRGAERALTIARAAQAATFAYNGKLLKVDIDRLTADIADQAHRRLTATEVVALRAYRQPHNGAVTVLLDADMSREALRNLRVADVDTDGRTETPLPLHPAGSLYLRAHRLTRLAAGATGEDPFFDQAPRALALAARRTASDLSLPTVAARRSSVQAQSDRWRQRLGVTLRDLTGPVAPPSPHPSTTASTTASTTSSTKLTITTSPETGGEARTKTSKTSPRTSSKARTKTSKGSTTVDAAVRAGVADSGAVGAASDPDRPKRKNEPRTEAAT